MGRYSKMQQENTGEGSDLSVLAPEDVLVQMTYQCSVLPFEVKHATNIHTSYMLCVCVMYECMHACADALVVARG